jgi:hypothetical protein
MRTRKVELGKYFEYFKELNLKYSIKVENTYNMDEHGTSLGAANTTRAIGGAAWPVGRSTHRKLPENTEWVTVC